MLLSLFLEAIYPPVGSVCAGVWCVFLVYFFTAAGVFVGVRCVGVGVWMETAVEGGCAELCPTFFITPPPHTGPELPEIPEKGGNK
jgi:hypothetical protein